MKLPTAEQVGRGLGRVILFVLITFAPLVLAAIMSDWIWGDWNAGYPSRLTTIVLFLYLRYDLDRHMNRAEK